MQLIKANQQLSESKLSSVSAKKSVKKKGYSPNSRQKWTTTSNTGEIASLSYKLRFQGDDTYRCFPACSPVVNR